MATDYIVFIHGLNLREGYFRPTYADELFRLIQNAGKLSSRNIQKIALYWDDVNEFEEQKTLAACRASPIWKSFWFRELREKQILHLLSSAALYSGRSFSARVADRLNQQVQLALATYPFDSETHLHLVSHGLGTFILFDILFASRWDQQGLPSNDSVRTIRQNLFGIEPNWRQGFRLTSICTMGLPIGLFSLLSEKQNVQDAKIVNGDPISTQDIAFRFKAFSERLLETLGTKLLWRNFSHPGDPLACPLLAFLPNMVDAAERYLEIQDLLLRTVDLSDIPLQPSDQSRFGLLYGGVAHNSYWQSEEVAQAIAQAIQVQTSSSRSGIANSYREGQNTNL